MRTLRNIVLTGIVAGHWAISVGDDLKIACPESIDSAESLSPVADSWQVGKDLGKRGKFLDSIAVYSGNPAEMGSLVPDKIMQKNRKRTYTWNFSEQPSEEYWVACTYTNSILLLAKKLPAPVRKCELTERLLPNGVKLAIDSMRCEL